MIRQATVDDVSKKRVTKLHGLLVVTTQYYPRFLKRQMIDEYVHTLAPTRELLHEFKDAEVTAGDHDRGFEAVDYESKFTLTDEGMTDLGRLAALALERPVYLVCHCKVGQYCHREILMLIAEKEFGAKIGKITHPWTTVRRRLESGARAFLRASEKKS